MRDELHELFVDISARRDKAEKVLDDDRNPVDMHRLERTRIAEMDFILAKLRMIMQHTRAKGGGDE